MDDRQQHHRNAAGASGDSLRDAATGGETLDESLLSAYLDGECTAAEQAAVEKRIEASAELRQAVEELRGVRNSLELLPQYRLGADFADGVMRRAEREVLLGDGVLSGSPAGGSTAESESPRPAKSPARDEPARGGGARPFLWTLAALAAAILILVVNQEPPMRRAPLAQGPKAPSVGENLKRAEPMRRDVEDFKEQSREQSLRGGEEKQAADQPDSDAARSFGAERGRSTGNFPSDDAMRDQEAAPANVAARDKKFGAQDARQNANGVEDAAGNVLPMSEPADKLESEAMQLPQRATEGAAATQRARNMKDSAESRGLDAKDTQLRLQPSLGMDKEARPPEPSGATREPRAQQPDAAAPRDALAVDAQNAPEGERAAVAGVVPAQAPDAALAFEARRESLRIVQVLVERDAWQRGAVNEVFAKNRIAVYGSDLLAAGAVSGPPAEPGDKAKAVGEELAAETDAPLSLQDLTTDGVELLVVSAPAGQVEAALGDFGQQDEFQLLQVTDASAPAQLYRESLFGRNPTGPTDRFGESPPSLPSESADRRKTEPADEKQDGAALPATATPQRQEDVAKKEAGAPLDSKANETAAPQESKIGAVKPDTRRAARVAPGSRGASPAAGASASVAEPAETLAVPEGDQAGRGYYRGASEAETRGGYGGGGFGARPGGIAGGGSGSRYAGRQSRAGGYGAAVSPAGSVPNAPLGFGQRVMLRQEPIADGKSATTSEFNFRSIAQGGPVTTKTAQLDSLAPEQVLFVFRVVDAPLAKSAADTIKSATSTGASSTVRQNAAQQNQQDAPPVPAPAPAAGPAK